MKKQFIIKDKDKMCPDCSFEIESKWESCYNLEWCPKCGCNIEECKKLGELK